ncbi:primosomal protein N', partial [Nocardia asiatica]|uniref:primosomal protein N' n=1 Tax=Nocardia asiatica TaxID=209252 RepID=UPI0024558EC5
MRLPIARVLPLLSPAHLDRDFDYLVPPELDELAQPGVRVRVRFAGRLVDGYLLARSAHTDHGGKLVKLERVVSGERVLTPEILELAGAVAARYAGTRADVLRLAIPPRHARTETGGRKKPAAEQAHSAEAVISEPASSTGPGECSDVLPQSASGATFFDSRSADPDVAEAETADSGDGSAQADGVAARTDEPETGISVDEQPLPAGSGAAGTSEPGASGRPRTADGGAGAAVDAEQDVAADLAGRGDSQVPLEHMNVASWGRYVHGAAFVDALAQGKGARAAWQALPGEDWPRRLAELAAVVAGQGRSAILMVPDQRDLDRVLAECVRLVGDSAVGLAAGLGPAARYRRWLAVLRGSARVVVGTRSAVFAPAVDLGLIAVWDDGDDTYAEPRAPYPHAREVAMLRAHETGAAFVAAGFARTAEIQAVVDSGWAHDLVADRAVLRKAAPRISAPGDSDIALERDPVARAVRIPGVAFTAARAALKEGAPVLVQVPRRGYIPALACGKCRTPARCRHCNGPLALPEARASRGSAAEVGAAAQSPACRWCGITEAAFRCTTCGSRALRAVVIGAARTAEELGRAFPGVPIRGSGGGTVLDAVEPGPQVVVSTVGAEPVVAGGYGVALLLDGWALLGRADLRAAEDALRRWMAAAALVRAHGQVIVVAEPAIPTVQALVRWDPVGAGAAPRGRPGPGGGNPPPTPTPKQTPPPP